MRKVILFAGVFSLLLGFVFDLNAISSTGLIFFSIGFTVLICHVVLDFNNYSPFLTFNKIMRGPLERVFPFLLKSAGRIMVLLLCALSILTVGVSLFFRSTEAFEVLSEKVLEGRASEAKFGFIITGNYFSSSNQNTESIASFGCSLFENSKGLRVNAKLKKKNDQWIVEEYSIK